MKQAQITDRELIAALKHMAPETGSLLCSGCGYERRCATHGCAILREAAARLTELTAPPPNDPLTLEELREMDGEPVWIVGADAAEIDRNGYAVMDFHIWGRENAPVILWFGSATENEPNPENYGKAWRAYRRRPEEGT